MKDLVTFTEVINYLDIDLANTNVDGTTLLNGLIEGTTQIIADYLGYEPLPDSTRHTEFYSLERYQAVLRPRFRPLWKVIDIWIDEDRIWATTDRIDSTAYHVNKNSDLIEFDGNYGPGQGSLKITYDAGWKETTSPLPLSIWLRALQLLALYWRRDHVGAPKEGASPPFVTEKEILKSLNRYRTRPVG